MTRRVNSPSSPNSASFRSNSAFSYTGLGIWRGSVRKPAGGNTSMRPSAWMMPVRNVIEEMCPSPGGAQAENKSQRAWLQIPSGQGAERSTD